MKEFEEAIRDIMQHYGYEAQREMFVEEMAEATQAVQKCKRYGTPEAFKHLQEEVADVLVTTLQMVLFLGEDDIYDIVFKKIDRQIERIEKEKSNE